MYDHLHKYEYVKYSERQWNKEQSAEFPSLRQHTKIIWMRAACTEQEYEQALCIKHTDIVGACGHMIKHTKTTFLPQDTTTCSRIMTIQKKQEY